MVDSNDRNRVVQATNELRRMLNEVIKVTCMENLLCLAPLC